jgi:hypothetical protein
MLSSNCVTKAAAAPIGPAAADSAVPAVVIELIAADVPIPTAEGTAAFATWATFGAAPR